MKIDSPLNQALLGIQRGLDSAGRHAAAIAGATRPEAGHNDKLTESMVGLIQDELQIAASARVLKAADEMIGSLFDDSA
jgi:hypothetical protein